MKSPKRLVIIGLPGSGKSTFAAKLGKILHVPVHHLDRHMFLPGGKKRDRQEFLEIQKQMLAEESWIIEGCALSSLEMRFSKADTVIYFYYPRLLCIWRVFKRLFSHDKTLCDTAEGCSKVITWEIIKYIWNFERDKREDIEALRKKYPQVDFVIFTTPTETNNYIEKLKRNKR